ncbi:unnamed protein product [Rotaria magnacalcarata]|uniref:NAD(P)(+)--arginine ADP-ribosyltransferase n=2 Tax=Rotaria magnacalcarata TaxID=392030 RepID=A0A816C3L4_9BILA|nr:unnamed protein product [Rotaria magnacalcarata]
MGLRNSKVGVASNDLYFSIEEQCPLVWLTSDSTINLNKSHISNLLQGIFSHLEIFHDIDRRIDYITSPNQKTMVLVIARPINDMTFLVKILLDLKQIGAIYIYSDTNYYPETSEISNIHRFKGIFTDIIQLENDLKEHVRILRWFKPVNFTTTSANQGTNDDDHDVGSSMEISFVFGSLIRDIFLEAPIYKNERDDFFYDSHNRFANDRARLNIIKQFKRTYRPGKAIYWYTTNTFLYEELNKALREQDFDLLFILRFFIRDLNQQLSKIAQDNMKKENTFDITLYRGQGMSKADFEGRIRKRVGGLLWIHEFLSTSRCLEVAEMFVLRDPTIVSILFEIHCNEAFEKRCFADIKIFSKNPDEEECLFQMGTVFRIDSVECIQNNEWKVRLFLSSTNQEKHRDQALLYDTLRTSIFSEPTILHRLARMLFLMGQYSKAKEMYTLLLETTSIEDRLETVYLNFKIGRIFDEEGDPEQAYRHFCQSLEYLPPNSHGKLQTPFIHYNLGHTLQQMGRLDEARDHIEKGFLSAKRLEDEHDSNAWRLDSFDVTERYLTNLAFVLSREGKFEDALTKHRACLRLRLHRYHSIEKWKYGESYSNIASSYLDMLDYNRALEYYQKALLMQRKHLVPTHPARATSYYKMSCVLQLLGELDSATYYARLAFKQLQHTSVSHSRINEYKKRYDELFQELLTQRIQAFEINSMSRETNQ